MLINKLSATKIHYNKDNEILKALRKLFFEHDL